MLQELRIKNLAVVEDVTLSFDRGLNVLTGSTGAGKSLVLSAVNLLLGGRGNARAIRAGCDKASVEGVFEIREPLADKLLSGGSMGGTRVVKLRREIDRNGRSHAYVNDRPTTLRQLQEISVELIEPHGQNEQLQLKHAENHLVYLDKFAGSGELLSAYRGAFEKYQDAASRLGDFERNLALVKEKKELLEHRVGEIAGAGIEPGEKEELEESIRVLAHGQEVFEVLSEAGEAIYDSESSAVSIVAQVRKRFARIEALDAKLAAFAEQLERVEIQLSEVVSDLRAYLDRLDFEPGRLEAMQERLDLLVGLERRYQMPVDELIGEGRKWSEELESLVFEDEERERLTGAKRAALRQLRDAGVRLSRFRREAAKVLDKNVTAEIERLMIRGARFRTDFGYEVDDDSELTVDKHRVRPRGDGIDDVVFYVRTNPGEAGGSVADVASSGELSRMALALKSVVSVGREGSVLVFDELDAGVGADMGGVMAAELETLADKYQIICITHMPQIAARAANHLVVRKASRQGRTFTYVEPARGDERVQEIARMLGGREGSQKRLALAKEMLHLKKTRVSSNVRP
jgi:DNA repair protein RecN (Recombination protein N)